MPLSRRKISRTSSGTIRPVVEVFVGFALTLIGTTACGCARHCVLADQLSCRDVCRSRRS